MSKFNPKVFQNKDRIYISVPKTNGIHRLYQWDGNEYRPGNYEARRYDRVNGNAKTRVKKTFGTLHDARLWQQGALNLQFAGELVADPGKSFDEIIDEWERRKFSTLSVGTQINYAKIVRLHIRSLGCLGIYELTPQKIDEWIDSLKDPCGSAMQSSNRKSFVHELTLLQIILRYYENYYDDPKFRFPIKQRHRDAVKLSIPGKPKSKDMTEEEFKLFRAQFVHIKNGQMYEQLATVQFYQALRISEAAAIYWEDVQMVLDKPSHARLKIVRSAFWPRKKGMASSVKDGFKNSKANQGMKEQPIFIATHAALVAMKGDSSTGLVFSCEGKLL